MLRAFAGCINRNGLRFMLHAFVSCINRNGLRFMLRVWWLSA
jgi:hypothetical protein